VSAATGAGREPSRSPIARRGREPLLWVGAGLLLAATAALWTLHIAGAT
jgi:hypothetical protein